VFENDSISASKRFLIIDGSNVATMRSPESGQKTASLGKLLSAVETLRKLYPDRTVKIFVDANFRHLVSEEERGQVDSMLASLELLQPGPKTKGRADRVILEYASDADALIVSNDGYREFVDEYPIVSKPDTILNFVFDPDLGWKFTFRG
jgi:hypothetical protein